MEREKIREALNNLRNYIEQEEYKGYDPYDTLNSVLPLTRFGKWPAAVFTQIQKRNPINIRPVIGIRKDHNPKGLGLILHAYCLLQKEGSWGDLMPQIKKLFALILELKSEGYSGICWGYNFTWASPVKVLPAYSPNVVVTAFVAKGIYEYYQLTGDAQAQDMLISIADFVLKDLERTESAEGICFSYTTIKKDCCYNASLLAAEVLAMVYALNGDRQCRELALKAMDFVVSRQKPDGSWYYSMDPDTGIERKQIDFHQGYVIDSIQNLSRLLKEEKEEYAKAVQRGLKFYREQQFFPDGRSLWRVPEEYPVEIHNQSQGILTFNRHSEYKDFAMTIAEWTIENMLDRKGYFYYRKGKWFTNRIPYMRWSQAWMLLALTILYTAPANEE